MRGPQRISRDDGKDCGSSQEPAVDAEALRHPWPSRRHAHGCGRLVELPGQPAAMSLGVQLCEVGGHKGQPRATHQLQAQCPACNIAKPALCVGHPELGPGPRASRFSPDSSLLREGLRCRMLLSTSYTRLNDFSPAAKGSTQGGSCRRESSDRQESRDEPE